MPNLYPAHVAGDNLPAADWNSAFDLAEGSVADLGPYVISGLVPTAGAGLSVNVSLGVASIGGRISAVAFSIGGLTPSTTNHLYLLQNGTGTANTSGTAPSLSAKLGTCITGGSTVTSVQTDRPSGRQLKVRSEAIVHGSGAGHPRAVHLNNWLASADDGCEVTGVLPAGAIAGGTAITSAAFTSRPAAGNLGHLFLPNDGVTVDYDNGSSWSAFGPIFPFQIDFGTGAFTAVNAGSSAFTSEKDSLLLTAPGGAVINNMNAYVKTPALLGSDYSVTIYAQHNILTDKQYPKMGLVFRESGTGKLVSFHLTSGFLYTTKWNNATGVSGDYQNRGVNQPINWLRIRDDQTDLIFYVSADGRQFLEIDRRARTNFLAGGPDQIGVFVDAGNLGTPNYSATLRLLHFREQ